MLLGEHVGVEEFQESYGLCQFSFCPFVEGIVLTREDILVAEREIRTYEMKNEGKLHHGDGEADC